MMTRVPLASENLRACPDRPTGARQWQVSYRRFMSFKDGLRIMLRFLNERDRGNFIQLFNEASEEDIRFLKHNLKDMRSLNYWLDHLDYDRALPLVAVNLKDHCFAGSGILLKGKHSAQHIGEIRIFVSRRFRNLGLGSMLLDELISLAARANLHYLKAEVVTEQTRMLKALSAKRFEIKALLDDFFLCRDGDTHDVILMMRPVVSRKDWAPPF